MKKLLYISFFISGAVIAQSAFYNSGVLQVHEQAQMGFHLDLINDGPFDANQSLIGFYGNAPLLISGNVVPNLFDTEFFTTTAVFLNTSLSVANNVNFVSGNVVGPANEPTINVNFLDNAFFTGENDASKVVGFAAITNKATFSFPVGDDEMLRPLLLNSAGNNTTARCAYFSENPNQPLSYQQQFDVNRKVRDIGQISQNEFWVLQGSVSSRVTLSWNNRSNLGTIANAAEEIIIVGWNLASRQWVVLGNSAFAGDTTQGMLTSDSFVPDNYGAITFGNVPIPTDTFVVNNPTLGNYFLSPNGDGVNDFLVIDGLEESPNNSLHIFNRFGQKVFEKINYTNEFTGYSNMNNFVISRDTGLPEGVYYYMVTLDDLELQYQGFLFLDRNK